MANNNYLTKFKFRSIKAFQRTKVIRHTITLDQYRKKHIKFYYSNSEIVILRKLLNIGQGLMRMALTKRFLLNKFVQFKYLAMYNNQKTFPSRYYYSKYRFKRRRYKRIDGKKRFCLRKFTRLKKWKRKKKKKKLGLRMKHFLAISYDNFLLYLTTLNNKLIIKPFNFFHSLFFYKSKTFKIKYYRLIKRKRRRRRFIFKKTLGRRNPLRRCRMKKLKYKFKRRFVKNRFIKQKIKSFKYFYRFVAFFNVCKKINLNKTDIFKIRSISFLPYKLLKFKYNKITNSYYSFIALKKRKLERRKINFSSIYNNKLTINQNKLYQKIKYNLLNKHKLNYKFKLNLLIFDKEENYKIDYYSIFYFLIQKLFFEYNLESIIYKTLTILPNKYNFLIRSNLIKLTINNNSSFKIKQFKNMIKLIIKNSKRLIFFEKTLNNVKKKKKKYLSSLILTKVLKFSLKKKKNKNKLINLYKNKYKNVIENLFFIVNYFQNKLEKLILNFYILFLNYKKNYKNFYLFEKKKFIKKLNFFLKKKKRKKIIFPFFFSKKKFLFFKARKLPLEISKRQKEAKRPWLRKISKKRKNKRLKKVILKRIYKYYFYKDFNIYAQSFKKLKRFSSFFYGKKLKHLQFNHLRRINTNFFNIKQINKNLNFLNVK